jgi:hypothetical protein
MDETKSRDPIPEFETLDDIAEFWDKHSTADYDDLTHEVQFEVRLRSAEQAQMVTLCSAEQWPYTCHDRFEIGIIAL